MGIAYPSDFLLPKDAELEKWAVIACDQYTSQKERWEEMAAAIGSAPSTLNLILPEAYLDEAKDRIPRIHESMDALLNGQLAPAVKNGMVLTERSCLHGTLWGLVVTVDLEAYAYGADSKSPIRPTEGTVLERIPPRAAVRRGAKLETSHILMLIDDPKETVIEPMVKARKAYRKLYDLDLLANGGHLSGYAVEGAHAENALKAINALTDAAAEGGIALAVGDGNHSLATAKACWEEIKQTLNPDAQETHPARFATVEVINLYEPALVFEPIHRLALHTSADAVLKALASAGARRTDGAPDAVIVSPDGDIPVVFERPKHTLPVGTVQDCLDEAKIETDYVHGENDLRGLVKKGLGTGILLPPMDKSLLFPSVEKNGPLPRKTFSMGEANEKRYYMEVRRIG
ncbi:MAG: DUF1015 domain-containing protein [Clostridia bacterium]|nr:DUF1015 domain-containing protein [Clostridia bacterium]